MSLNNNAEDILQIAQRLDNRPGFELVNCVSVGLPVTRMTLTILTLRHKPIPPIEEFILKAIDTGLSSLEEISNFLGLEYSVTKDAMINLRQLENIDLIASKNSKIQVWKLTKKGKNTLTGARIIVPEERTYKVNFDKMLRKPRWYGKWEQENSLLRLRELRQDNIPEIPAYPPDPPELADLKIQEIKQVIRQIALENNYKKEDDREFIGLKSIERNNFFQPALALVYKQINGSEFQISFIIDGRLSEEHESAFSRGKGGKKTRIIKQLTESISSQLKEVKNLAEEKLGQSFVKQVDEYEERINSVKSQISSETQKIEEQIKLTQKIYEENQNDVEKQSLEKQLNEAKQKIEELKKQLEKVISSTPIRYLKTHEHRPLLERALQQSQERLLIIAPWIRANASNQWLIQKLKTLLTKGVKVFIGYGFGDEEKEERKVYDIRAEEDIKKLAERYKGNFVFKRLGDTHCKILVSDRQFGIVGSFNWLSFKGDPNSPFRDERSILVSDSQKIDELFENEIKRLKSQ